LVFALTLAQSSRAQVAGPAQIVPRGLFEACETCLPTNTCKVYSLADLGDDPALGKWIADTIPQMIQSGSWTGADGKSKLSYFAPGKVLVINQTAAVHGQVDDFLQSLKKTLPHAKVAKRDPQVMPAQFTPPGVPQAGPMVTPSQAYPVPYPPQTPKHLFHFIIRYEGDGVIDSNVVKFAKALGGEAAGAFNQYSVNPTACGEATSNGVLVPTSGMTLPSPQYLRHAPEYYPPASTCPTPSAPVRNNSPTMPLADGSVPTGSWTVPQSPPVGSVPPPPPFPGQPTTLPRSQPQ
jgi:hypothetical protein